MERKSKVKIKHCREDAVLLSKCGGPMFCPVPYHYHYYNQTSKTNLMYPGQVGGTGWAIHLLIRQRSKMKNNCIKRARSTGKEPTFSLFKQFINGLITMRNSQMSNALPNSKWKDFAYCIVDCYIASMHISSAVLLNRTCYDGYSVKNRLFFLRTTIFWLAWLVLKFSAIFRLKLS